MSESAQKKLQREVRAFADRVYRGKYPTIDADVVVRHLNGAYARVHIEFRHVDPDGDIIIDDVVWKQISIVKAEAPTLRAAVAGASAILREMCE